MIKNKTNGSLRPDLSATTDEVRVLAWRVQVGEPVKRGQPILEVETDKAVMEVECVATGVLKQVLVEPDTTVSAGQVIALIATADAGSTETGA